jgi:hypothetical protein
MMLSCQVYNDIEGRLNREKARGESKELGGSGAEVRHCERRPPTLGYIRLPFPVIAVDS